MIRILNQQLLQKVLLRSCGLFRFIYKWRKSKLRPAQHADIMDVDPFTPPPQRRTTTGGLDAVRISKSVILSMISQTPFDGIYIHKDLITDDETNTVSFLEALGQALVTVLIQHLPQKSSPKKLLSSSLFPPGPHLHSHQEADTPTKPRMKPEKKPSSMFVNRILSNNALGFMSRLALEPPKLDQAEWSVEQKKARAMQAFREEEFKLSNSSPFALTLTRAEPVDTEPRDFLASQITWKHPPDFPRIDPIAEPSRLEELLKINLDSDPFHISRMERRKSELHPFAWIRGRVQAYIPENGNLPPGFQSEFQEVAGLALLDTGNDVTVITEECLGWNLGRRERVWFTFE